VRLFISFNEVAYKHRTSLKGTIKIRFLYQDTMLNPIFIVQNVYI